MATKGMERKDDGLVLGGRFAEALRYAATVHHGHLRKGTAVPYVSHLLGVTALVLEDGGDENEAIAALLHDAVEDRGGPKRLAEIRRRFGDGVAGIVDACTDADTEPKPPWRLRKETYLRHLHDAPPEVLRVSVADKLHNARAILADFRRIGDAVFARFKGGKDGTLWYYGALVKIYKRRGVRYLGAELERVVRELRRRERAA